MLRALFIAVLLILVCLSVRADEDQNVREILQRIDLWTGILESKSPEYVWGGSDPDVVIFDDHKRMMRKGLDCSGGLYWVFKHSGLGYIRTTALKMFLGAWPGYNLDNWQDARFPDLIFFTMNADRPHGHVGLVRHVKKHGVEMSHASSQNNKFMGVFLKADSKMLKKMSGVRVLDLMTRKPEAELPQGHPHQTTR